MRKSELEKLRTLNATPAMIRALQEGRREITVERSTGKSTILRPDANSWEDI